METKTTAPGAPGLRAGVAKVDITNTDAGPVNDPLYAKALALSDGTLTMVLATVDAVAIAEIGFIRNEFFANVRAQLQDQPGLKPEHIVINASHCHGSVCADVEQRMVQVIGEACQNMVPVTAGAGVGHEDRIMENRRLKLKDGREADVRQAYSLVDDAEVEAVGPVDPEIGILRLDREDGRTLAVVYNFACHPILGVPNGGNTADISGFASRAIEDNLSDGTLALFLQGCGGDVNPAYYKMVDHLRGGESLGNMLGLSTLRALRGIPSRDGGVLKIIRETMALPRADLTQRIEELEAEQAQLLRSLKGININLKTFISLYVKHHLAPDSPSHYSYRYMHEEMMGRTDLARLDEDNRRSIETYIDNIHAMEQLTRVRINMDLLKKHQARREEAGSDTIEVEVVGVRIGDFVLVTFPGELSVQIGLNIKKRSPHELTFVSGVTNGYIYYTPTAEQLQNVGRAQEDSDCLVAPEWQMLFENKAAEILDRLS